jgi:hypothetical protein
MVCSSVFLMEANRPFPKRFFAEFILSRQILRFAQNDGCEGLRMTNTYVTSRSRRMVCSSGE